MAEGDVLLGHLTTLNSTKDVLRSRCQVVSPHFLVHTSWQAREPTIREASLAPREREIA